MHISHKSNVLQEVHDTEWQCRMYSKGLDTTEYWTWLETITTQDEKGNDIVTYPSEDFTIVECTDEDVWERLAQLNDYQSNSPDTGIIYNIKYYASKRDSEIDGVKSHFIKDDTAKDKRILDEEWTQIRAERTRLLGDTDHHALSDQTLSDDMKTYRKSLRDLPSAQSSKTKYSDITWPTKP